MLEPPVHRSRTEPASVVECAAGEQEWNAFAESAQAAPPSGDAEAFARMMADAATPPQEHRPAEPTMGLPRGGGDADAFACLMTAPVGTAETVGTDESGACQAFDAFVSAPPALPTPPALDEGSDFGAFVGGTVPACLPASTVPAQPVMAGGIRGQPAGANMPSMHMPMQGAGCMRMPGMAGGNGMQGMQGRQAWGWAGGGMQSLHCGMPYMARA